MLLFTLLVCGCSNNEPLSKHLGDVEESNGFSLAEAQGFLEDEIEKMPVKQTRFLSLPHKRTFSPGNFIPLWNRAMLIRKDSLLYFELPIMAQNRYKASIPSSRNGERKEVRIYQRLMVLKNLNTKQKFYYFTTFIPDPDSKGKSRCEGFMRQKNHNNYSGLVLYINPKTNTPIRVDRYEKGERTAGVFLSGKIDGAVRKIKSAESLIGNISISKVSLASARSFDEDDWDWENADLTDNGEGSWIYQGPDGNYYEVIDTDGDNKPDSIVMTPIVVTPEEGDDDDDTPQPETDTQDPDPTTYPELEDGGGGDGGSSSPTIKANVRIEYKASDFPGYGYNNMDCFKLANYILKKALGQTVSDLKSYAIKIAGANAFATKYSIEKIISLIDDHLDNNRPIKVGVDYKKGGNTSDGVTDHWIVINGRGYDSVKNQYYYIYIETGRSSERASSAVGDNRLYYYEDNGIISGYKYDGISIYILNQIRTNK